MTLDSICEKVRKAEENYLHGTTTIGKYVNWSMYDTIERIFAYLNSKHVSGDKDSLGRDKPFFNIVSAAVNIWYRATDLDRKDIRFVPTNLKSVPLAFVANVILQNWMDKVHFGRFLNEWGRTIAQYGSVVRKFVERDGELYPSVVPWSRIIPDPVDFDSLPRIEKLYKTPGQLKDMATPGHPNYAGYDLEVVEDLINSRGTRDTLNGQQRDNMAEFIEIYEVHGLMDSRLLEDEPNEDAKPEYVQQMHVVTFVAAKVTGEFKDFTLFKGLEKRDVYGKDDLIHEEGRTLSIGAVEYLFDSQWMHNHAMKAWKDNMDLASKMIFQTADGNFVGRNVLNAIENGQILIHKENMPIVKVANDEYDTQNVQAFVEQWRLVAGELTSTPDAIKGNTLPSGTPYSLGAYLGQQANSLFEIMTENKGLALEDMITEYVIPHIKKKLKNKDEVVAILDAAGITEIDQMYIPAEAARRYNAKAVPQILDALETDNLEMVPEPYNQTQAEDEVRNELAQLGNRRAFIPDEMGEKEWADVFSDFNWESVKVQVTNERVDKQAVLQTLASLYTATAQTDPIAANVILGKVLTETGVVSPLEVSSLANRPVMPQAAGEINNLVPTQ